MRGKILSVVAGVYNVLLENNEMITITPRGKFRFQKLKPCVGDDVNVDNGVIDHIYERKNILIRPNVSNIDYMIVVSSLKEPDFSSYLLDKFLTLLISNNISPIIVLSKVDLVSKDVANKIEEDYKVLNYPIFKVSKRTGEGVKELSEFIKGKVVAFSGQTGAGKSSLINLISPEFNRKEGQYSKFLNRGKHQTKEVILLPFVNSFLVDTPGFSSLELQMYKENLKDHFPFFKLTSNDCFFLDCMHINEPKCEIKKMLENGILTREHYDNYCQIFDELVYRKDRFK